MTEKTGTSDSGYAGQQGLTDANSQFNQQHFLVWQILGRVQTIAVVIVKAVRPSAAGAMTAESGVVDIQPLVRQIDGQGKTTPHGIINNIPYFRLQGGANAVVVDPEVGDIGIALMANRDISAVKKSKAEAAPGSYRKFDWADGIYLGGILGKEPTQLVQFLSDGVKLSDKNGNVLQMGESGITVNGVLFSRNRDVTNVHDLGVEGGAAVTGNVTVHGAVTADGDGTFAGTSVHTHRHSGVQTGNGTSGPPV